MFFQCPWLPEFMLTAQDVALFDGCFRSGPIAPRTQGAVSNEDIERCSCSSHTMQQCSFTQKHHAAMQLCSVLCDTKAMGIYSCRGGWQKCLTV